MVTQLAHRLEQWTDVHGGTVYAGVNVDLTDDTHLEPDLVDATTHPRGEVVTTPLSPGLTLDVDDVLGRHG